MPIKTNELIKKALNEDEEAVFDLLKENTGTSYTEEDIIKELNEYISKKYNNLRSTFEKQKALENFKLLTKLGKLIRLKLVRKAVNKGKEYFYVD